MDGANVASLVKFLIIEEPEEIAILIVHSKIARQFQKLPNKLFCVNRPIKEDESSVVVKHINQNATSATSQKRSLDTNTHQTKCLSKIVHPASPFK